MVEAVDCERCGSALSYGEVFRHRIAEDVSAGTLDSKRILGDRLSPRKPRKLCSPCRTDISEHTVHRPLAKRQHWFFPLMSAVAGAMVMAIIMNVRRA
jgi:hypothetical protein